MHPAWRAPSGRGRGIVCEDSSDEEDVQVVIHRCDRGVRLIVVPVVPGSSSRDNRPTTEELASRFGDLSTHENVAQEKTGGEAPTASTDIASSSVPVTSSEGRSFSAEMGYYHSIYRTAGKAESVANL